MLRVLLVSARELWRLGRKDRRAGVFNPPPLLPEFGGAKDEGRCAYERGYAGFKF